MGAMKDLMIKAEERRAEAEAALMRRIMSLDGYAAEQDRQYEAFAPVVDLPPLEFEDVPF